MPATYRYPFAQSARSRSSVGIGTLALLSLANTSRFARQLPQVIQLGATHAATPHDLHFCNDWCLQREYTLDTHARRDLPHSERLTIPGTPAANAHAFERLQSLFLTLANTDGHPHRIARSKFGNIVSQVLCSHRF